MQVHESEYGILIELSGIPSPPVPVFTHGILFCLLLQPLQNGDFKNALTAFEGILASLLQAYGEEHYRVGAALHNVGIANLRAGKLDDAMASIEEAVRMRKSTLGDTHPKVAVSAMSVAVLSSRCDFIAHAGDLHHAAPLLQDSLVELGIIQLSLNEYDEALKVFSEALYMREQESREITHISESKEAKLKEAKVLNNIGCVHFEREDSEQALLAYDSAVKLQRSALQTESRNFSALSQPASKPSYLTMACTLCNKGTSFMFSSKRYKSITTHLVASLQPQDMQSLT